MRNYQKDSVFQQNRRINSVNIVIKVAEFNWHAEIRKASKNEQLTSNLGFGWMNLAWPVPPWTLTPSVRLGEVEPEPELAEGEDGELEGNEVLETGGPT